MVASLSCYCIRKRRGVQKSMGHKGVWKTGMGHGHRGFKTAAIYKTLAFAIYHPLQNHYTHEIIIFELFRGLQLQLSGVFRINLHYSYSFLVFLAECSYRK